MKVSLLKKYCKAFLSLGIFIDHMEGSIPIPSLEMIYPGNS